MRSIATCLPVSHAHFLLSRTDAIGDVVLALPMAGVLKEAFPDCRVSLLCAERNMAVARACRHIDGAYAWNLVAERPRGERICWFRNIGADVIIHVRPLRAIAALARQARIPLRIGTGRRLFHWSTCNRLVHLHRMNSPLHEAQLNLKLLKPFGVRYHYPARTVADYYGFDKIPRMDHAVAGLLDTTKFNLIVHPKSGGTSREWPLAHFSELLETLPADRFNIVVTGTGEERAAVAQRLPMRLPHVRDAMGKLSLDELISLVAGADALLAASTGPLHIAAALGRHALGIYAPLRSKRAGRWGPIGVNARVFQLDKQCAACRRSRDCACLRGIKPGAVQDHLFTLAASGAAEARAAARDHPQEISLP